MDVPIVTEDVLELARQADAKNAGAMRSFDRKLHRHCMEVSCRSADPHVLITSLNLAFAALQMQCMKNEIAVPRTDETILAALRAEMIEKGPAWTDLIEQTMRRRKECKLFPHAVRWSRTSADEALFRFGVAKMFRHFQLRLR